MLQNSTLPFLANVPQEHSQLTIILRRPYGKALAIKQSLLTATYKSLKNRINSIVDSQFKIHQENQIHLFSGKKLDESIFTQWLSKSQSQPYIVHVLDSSKIKATHNADITVKIVRLDKQSRDQRPRPLQQIGSPNYKMEIVEQKVVNSGMAVKKLIQMLKKQVVQNDIFLTYGGKILDGEKTLSEQLVENNSILECCHKGMKRRAKMNLKPDRPSQQSKSTRSRQSMQSNHTDGSLATEVEYASLSKKKCSSVTADTNSRVNNFLANEFNKDSIGYRRPSSNLKIQKIIELSVSNVGKQVKQNLQSFRGTSIKDISQSIVDIDLDDQTMVEQCDLLDLKSETVNQQSQFAKQPKARIIQPLVDFQDIKFIHKQSMESMNSGKIDCVDSQIVSYLQTLPGDMIEDTIIVKQKFYEECHYDYQPFSMRDTQKLLRSDQLKGSKDIYSPEKQSADPMSSAQKAHLNRKQSLNQVYGFKKLKAQDHRIYDHITEEPEVPKHTMPKKTASYQSCYSCNSCKKCSGKDSKLVIQKKISNNKIEAEQQSALQRSKQKTPALTMQSKGEELDDSFSLPENEVRGKSKTGYNFQIPPMEPIQLKKDLSMSEELLLKAVSVQAEIGIDSKQQIGGLNGSLLQDYSILFRVSENNDSFIDLANNLEELESEKNIKIPSFVKSKDNLSSQRTFVPDKVEEFSLI